MPTLTVDPASCRPESLRRAVDHLRAGRIVAIPTDTSYGLAVDPTSDAAVRRLFTWKGRPEGVALPLVAASVVQVERVCGALPNATALLAAAFWPGPLSLIVDAPLSVSAAVHGGRGTVAVRVPDHPVTMVLAEAFGGLLTATSANRSGEPPAKTAGDLGALSADDSILVIDAGPASEGPPSTLVDARQAVPTLVREGAVAWSRVLKSLGR